MTTTKAAAATKMIEIPASDFIQTHLALFRLLQQISKSGADDMSTRELCDTTFNSREQGMRVIVQAEKAAYIKRVKRYNKSKDRSAGRPYIIINILTRKGRSLLAKL